MNSEAQILYTKITNNSEFPDTLYPLYNAGGGHEEKYRNDDSLISWVVSQVPHSILVSGDTDLIHIALIKASAPLTKGNTKSGTINIFNENKCDNPDSAFVRKFSLIGSQLGAFHDHCGEQVRIQQEILTSTGYFSYNTFFTVTLGWHTVCAFLCKGDTVAVDFSANHPFLLIKNPAKRSGYASPTDLYKDTSLITPDQFFFCANDNGDTTHRNLTYENISEYRMLYAYRNPRVKNVRRTHDVTYKITDMWIMPPHSTVTWTDTFYYVVDTAKSGFAAVTMKKAKEQAGLYAVNRIKTGNIAYLDSVPWAFYNATAQIIGGSIDKGQDVFLQDKLIFYNSDAGWSPRKFMTAPILHISITAGKDSIVFGKDAYFGTGLVTGKRISSVDTAYISYNLWAKNLIYPSFVTSYKDINYLINNQTVIPPHSTLEADISYNPSIMDFYNGVTFRVSNPGALVIESNAKTNK